MGDAQRLALVLRARRTHAQSGSGSGLPFRQRMPATILSTCLGHSKHEQAWRCLRQRSVLFASYKLECVPNKGFARKRGRKRSNTSMPFTIGSAAGLSHPCNWVLGNSDDAGVSESGSFPRSCCFPLGQMMAAPSFGVLEKQRPRRHAAVSIGQMMAPPSRAVPGCIMDRGKAPGRQQHCRRLPSRFAFVGSMAWWRAAPVGECTRLT